MFYDCNKLWTYTLNMFNDRTELMFQTGLWKAALTFIIKTYHQVSNKGAPTHAVAIWIYCQSFINHATRPNRVNSILQEGTVTIQVLHLASVNSDCMLYCTVRSTPIANPMKNRSIVNINHEVENAASMFKTTSEAIDKNKGGFRPIKSAICPARRFPVSTPAICIEVIVCGIQEASQIKSHWNNTSSRSVLA